MSAKKFGPKDGGTYVLRAREKWHGNPPDWVMALAQACDNAGTQQEVAHLLRVSTATVSAAIGNSYPGGTGAMEARVRGALMGATVHCPVVGSEIGRDTCAFYQSLGVAAGGVSPMHAKLSITCPGLPGRTRPCINYLGGSK